MIAAAPDAGAMVEHVICTFSLDDWLPTYFKRLMAGGDEPVKTDDFCSDTKKLMNL
jgi:hypothetical protein